MFTLQNAGQHHFSGANDVYVLDLHRTSAGLAAITSDQQLSLLDPARVCRYEDHVGNGGPVVGSWATEHRGVAVLTPLEAKKPVVCTAGEDGAVAIWDMRRKGSAGRVAKFQASDAPITSLACNKGAHTVAVGTELQDQAASIILWDIRATSTPYMHYRDLHSEDVTSLSFHHTQPAFLLSGSADGLVSLHDTRVPNEDDVTAQTLNHEASVREAGFLSDDNVFALSHDEFFAIYDLKERDDGSDASLSLGDLRDLLQCQYVAGVKPKTDHSGAVLGIGSQSLVLLGRQDLERSWQLDGQDAVGLPGAHGEDIVRSFCFFDQEQLIFTAGEDGNIKSWRA